MVTPIVSVVSAIAIVTLQGTTAQAYGSPSPLRQKPPEARRVGLTSGPSDVAGAGGDGDLPSMTETEGINGSVSLV